MSIEERLARVERQNRRLRWTVVLSMVAGLGLLGVEAAHTGADDGLIRARGFALVDSAGIVRGVWGVTPKDEVNFSLFDSRENAMPYLTINLDKNGPTINLNDAQGRPLVAIAALGGKPGVMLADWDARPRLGLAVTKSAPGQIVILDEKGAPTHAFPVR